MQLVVTDHAVQQYRRRHAPDVEYDVAMQALLEHGSTATFRSRAAFKGDVFVLDALGCEVVMVDEDAKRTMVTVLPKRVEGWTAADRAQRAEELRVASEAADAARVEQAKLKAGLKAANELAVGTNAKSKETRRVIAQITSEHNVSKKRTDEQVLELSILRMEMRLANEQGQENAKIARRALVIAVRALVARGDSAAVLAEIACIEPYFATPRFYEEKP